MVAAELLDKLSQGIGALKGSDLHAKLESAWLQSGKNEDEETWGYDLFRETAGEHLRSVGFGYTPENTAVLVADLVDLVAASA